MSWIAVAVGGGALLSTGASLYSGYKTGEAMGDASDAQYQGDMASLDFQRQVREENKDILGGAMTMGEGYIDDSTDRAKIEVGNSGRRAISELRPMTNLMPLAAAYRMLGQGPGEMDPWEEREYNRGVETMQAGFSKTSGGGVSNRALEQAQVFGQDYAAKRLDDRLNRLMPFIQLAERSRGNIAGIQERSGARRSSYEIGRGTGKADIRMGGAKALASVPHQGISNTMSNIGDDRAGGYLRQADNTNQTLNNIFETGKWGVEQYFKNRDTSGGSTPAFYPTASPGGWNSRPIYRSDRGR